LPGSPNGYLGVVGPTAREDFRMPTWVWILLIVLLVLVLFGGVGYGRRGV
jgi:type VI protein secretion system component VasF